YAAAHQSYRFAATDIASESFKPKAVSWVLAGGLFAGVIGPQLIIFTKDIWQPFLYAATFVGQALMALLAGLVLMLLRIPAPQAGHKAPPGRPLFEIVRAPRFLVAVMCGVVSYAVMNLVMTSAPIAMVDCGHSVTAATLGLQWHILAMYGPSFFTGSLIQRFGTGRVALAGFVLLAASAGTGIAGITVSHFWLALILLGLGWNLAFVAATTMVTECYRPEERNKVQAFNDFLVFGSMAVGSFISGILLVAGGWEIVNGFVLPFIFAAAAFMVWLSFRERARPA
ncbi:MAG: MFS transporter, partial [Pseudorhodoplanes sp.]